MPKQQYSRSVGPPPYRHEVVELDTDANTFTVRSADDGLVVEERPLTWDERNLAELPDTPNKVRNLMDAVDQLILNDLLDL